MKRGRRRVAGMAPGADTAAGRKACLGEVAIAEPWVGVDSSKPPRLLVTVASPWVSGPSRRRLAGAGRRKPQPPRGRSGRLAKPKLRRSVGWAGWQTC